MRQLTVTRNIRRCSAILLILGNLFLITITLCSIDEDYLKTPNLTNNFTNLLKKFKAKNNSLKTSSKSVEKGDKEVPRRRLISDTLVTMAVDTIATPELIAPAVNSFKKVKQLLFKTREKSWKPELQWNIQQCQLKIEFTNGYNEEKIKKIAINTFAVYASRNTGRLHVTWSDRFKASTLWRKPRLQQLSIPSTGWCHFDDTSFYDIYLDDKKSRAVQAVYVQLKALEANSFRNSILMTAEKFQPILDERFQTKGQQQEMVEIVFPERELGWSQTHCMFQFIYRGEPRSHLVQWNKESLRGLLRFINVTKRKVVFSKEVHPLCTYDYGKELLIGEINLEGGQHKIIGFLKHLKDKEIYAPNDMVLIKPRQLLCIEDLTKQSSLYDRGEEIQSELLQRRRDGDLPPDADAILSELKTRTEQDTKEMGKSTKTRK